MDQVSNLVWLLNIYELYIHFIFCMELNEQTNEHILILGHESR
jgi:hypothetical protein